MTRNLLFAFALVLSAVTNLARADEQSACAQARAEVNLFPAEVFKLFREVQPLLPGPLLSEKPSSPKIRVLVFEDFIGIVVPSGKKDGSKLVEFAGGRSFNDTYGGRLVLFRRIQVNGTVTASRIGQVRLVQNQDVEMFRIPTRQGRLEIAGFSRLAVHYVEPKNFAPSRAELAPVSGISVDSPQGFHFGVFAGPAAVIEGKKAEPSASLMTEFSFTY